MLDAVAWARRRAAGARLIDADRGAVRRDGRGRLPAAACRRWSTSTAPPCCSAGAVERVLGADGHVPHHAEPRRRGLRLVPRPRPRRDGPARHAHAGRADVRPPPGQPARRRAARPRSAARVLAEAALMALSTAGLTTGSPADNKPGRGSIPARRSGTRVCPHCAPASVRVHRRSGRRLAQVQQDWRHVAVATSALAGCGDDDSRRPQTTAQRQQRRVRDRRRRSQGRHRLRRRRPWRPVVQRLGLGRHGEGHRGASTHLRRGQGRPPARQRRRSARSACARWPTAACNPVIGVGYIYTAAVSPGGRGVPRHELRGHRRLQPLAAPLRAGNDRSTTWST